MRDINKPTFGCVELEILIRSPSKNIKQAVGGSDGKESAYYAGDLDLIPGSGRSPGEGNGNPLQYSCLENSMDRRPWQAIDHGVTKSQTQLSHTCLRIILKTLKLAEITRGKEGRVLKY